MNLQARAAMTTVVLCLVSATSALSALAQPPGVQMRGVVESIDDGTVMLADGSTFPITDQTRVTILVPRAMADLSPGQYVAISAGLREGGVLDASVVSAFPEGTANTTGNQREMLEIRHCEPLCTPGDLMTNATITTIGTVDQGPTADGAGAEMTVAFAGNTGTVRMGPQTRVEAQQAGTLADVVPGFELIGFINPQGSAAGVWVFGS